MAKTYQVFKLNFSLFFLVKRLSKFSPNPSGPGFFEFSLEQDRFEDVPNNSSSNFPIINCRSGNWANMNSLPTPQLFFDFITKRKAWSLVLLPLGQVSALVVYMSSNTLQLTVGSLDLFHAEKLNYRPLIMSSLQVTTRCYLKKLPFWCEFQTV